MSGFGPRFGTPKNRNATKEQLTNICTWFILIFVTYERPISPQADPARHDPSEARAESCTCCGGGREPDPTDDNLRALRRLRDLALAVAAKLAARILDNDAGHSAAQEAAPEDAPDEPGDAPKPRSELPAAVLAFQRAERGVRQCILLSNKLHDDRLARETQKEAVSAKAEQQRRERRKSQVARLVKEAIKRDPGEWHERLQKLDARIDEEDIESDIGRIADSAIIARLCKDCGVEAPWKLWAGEHWALEEVRRKPPGSVYGFMGDRPPAAPPEPGPEAVEPVEVKPPQPEPPQPEPLQPQADEPAASAPELPKPEPPKPERPEPEPPKPEPDNPYETRMKARLAMAMHSGAWLQVLQTDPVLATYVRSRLNNSS